MGFRVGERVVCVDAKPRMFKGPGLTEGQIYTIKAYYEDGNGGGVDLEEIVPTPCLCFWADRFRPLQETGMSILREILANPRKELETVE